MKVSWFSAGVSSAVATKLSRPDRIIYTHITDQHPDTLRFIKECEEWFCKKVEIISSPLESVEMACRKSGALIIKGPRPYAPCTKHLKQWVRKGWEKDNPGRHTYVWGYDRNEKGRMERLVSGMPEYDHEFPLKELTKQDAHGILAKVGIRRPDMYVLGYPNNNCIGCIKGGMGYWNKIRVDFPEVFASRAKLEREFGHSILRECYLDQLDYLRGRQLEVIVEDCGIACELTKIEP